MYLRVLLNWFNGKDTKYFNIWYVGTQNGILEGSKYFYMYLEQEQLVLVDPPEIFDYLSGKNVIYVIVYHALSKLAYIEHRGKQVDKHLKHLKV